MPKPVMQTRCVGLAPDASGHALAPPEIVYECSEPERSPGIRLLEAAIYVAAPVWFCFLIWKIIEKALG